MSRVPERHHGTDGHKLSPRKAPEHSHQLGVRNRDEILRVEHTGTKHRNMDRDLKSGIAGAGRVRNEGHEGPVAVVSRDADGDRRPDVSRHAEIDEPYLAPLRRFHYDCS